MDFRKSSEDPIFKTNAVWNENLYRHFGITKELCSLYGESPDDIEEIEFKISERQTYDNNRDDTANSDYWGWWDEKEERFSMIYAKRFLLDMCFAYGIEASEKSGEGKAYRLEILDKAKKC